MEDAYLEDNEVDGGLVAWVRVGLMDSYENPPESSGPLLPIALCADDAVGDFGDFELKAAQFLAPLNAVTSDSVSLENLETWLYPTPPGFECSLIVTVWADTKAITIGVDEAEKLLKSHYLAGILSEVTRVDDKCGGGSIASSTNIGDRLVFRQLIRATAVVSRWGAKQSACIATAIAFALRKGGANGSISVQIETLPD